MFNFFKKQSIVGIDISDYSIEVLQLNKNKEVLAYNRAILEEGIVQDGKIFEKEKLVEKLKEILKNIKAKKVILSLPESKVFIGDSKIIPWKPEEVYADKIGELQIAAPKEIVDEYVEVIRLLGMEVIAFDIESLSLNRALMPTSYKLQATSSVMIIDIGARTTNVSIFNPDKLLALSITIPIAGKDFTKAVAEKLKIKIEEAEALKIKFGLDNKKDNKVLSILQASFQPVIKELKEAISHYENNKGEKIEEIILAGGSALLPKLGEYLSVNLDKKVVVGDPFKQVKDAQSVDKKYSPILFANVVGLALRAAGNIAKGVNLLQQTPSVKAAAWSRPQFSKLQISGFLQNIRKSRAFVISFIIISFAILGFVIYQNFFMPFTQETQTGEYSKEPPASEEAKVESPEIELSPPAPKESKLPTGQVSPSELSSEEAEVEKVEEVVIQDTPTGWLNVRSGPGTNYTQIAQVYSNEIYTLLQEKDRWYKIKIDEETQGWVASQYTAKK